MSDTTTECPYCGAIHKAICPRVKSIEYEVGMIKRVEFFAPIDYPKLELFPGGPKITARMSEDGIG